MYFKWSIYRFIGIGQLWTSSIIRKIKWVFISSCFPNTDLCVGAILPVTETIFVRVYESRMDLLRAVIIGAEGTPYHDGLFFFDVFFPSNYPNVPPV